MGLYRNRKLGARIPSQRARLHANAHFLHFGRIAERIAAPSVLVGLDARGDAKRGHRREPGERDERAAAVVRRANEPHEIDVAKKRSIGSPLSGEHHQTESAGTEQFVHGAERVHPALRAHEERAFFPERARDRARDVYPCRAVAVRHRGSARRAHDGCRAAARLPDGQPAEREPASRQRAVELRDPRGDRIGDVPRNLDSVWKTLFEQGSECSDLGRHGVEMIPNKYRRCKGRAIMLLRVPRPPRYRPYSEVNVTLASVFAWMLNPTYAALAPAGTSSLATFSAYSVKM